MNAVNAFHENLDYYINEDCRALSYLDNTWALIENDLIYYLGMFNSLNITIEIDSHYISVVITNNYREIFNKSKQLNFLHSVLTFEDFSIEITLNITKNNKFKIHSESCKLYYERNVFDEGIIEFYADIFFDIKDYYEFKKNIFLNIGKEIQYAINKNYFYLDIENDLVSEIDVEFEIVNIENSFNEKLEVKNLIELLYKENKLNKENVGLLEKLFKKIKVNNNV